MDSSESDEDVEILDLIKLNAVMKVERASTASTVLQHSASTSTASSTLRPISCTSTSLPSENSQEISKIEAAITFNKLTEEKLQRLEEMLVNRLHECRQKLKEIQRALNTVDKKGKYETFHYMNCGKPYFRDKSNFPAPDNEDAIIMEKSQMYDFSNVTSIAGWTVKDKSEFISVIHKMSKEIRKKELNSMIKQLQREAKKGNGTQIETEIEETRKEIDAVNKSPLKDIALPIDQEYDWDIISNQLNCRHSPQEYQSLWKLFLHPSINKSSWSREEHLSLQKIAHNYKLEDWDAIAKDLNTGRSGYQCFVYFRTNMNNTSIGQKWTKEEEEYLKRLIEYYREDNYIPWGKVAASMGNRTKSQIYNKYSRLLEQRKGRFLPEEDAVILTFVDKFGMNFKKMTEYLGGRSATQLRTRYHVLQKKRVSTVWTVKEDKQLIQLMANQGLPIEYSSICKYFPGKDRVTIRSRYLTLMRWMKQFPNTDIARAPRRGARRLGHGLASENLNKAIESLKNRFQCEVENRRCKKITKDSPEDAIDDAIVAALVNERIKEEEITQSETYNQQIVLEEDPTSFTMKALNMTNIKKTLVILKAKLDKNLLQQSSYREQYSDILNEEKDVSVVKVKSYSKKNTIQTVQVNGTPDIWGNTTLGSLEYVLPPHYSTITGCKKLMELVYSQNKEESKKNINLMMKRNVLLREQMDTLMERFNTLFLWPILLSNEMPNVSTKTDKDYVPRDSKKLTDKVVGVLPGITIPDIKSEDVVNEKIDLVELDQPDKITLEQINLGDQLMYLDKFKKIKKIYVCG